MHKGKQYPFNPKYWVCQGAYWPEFMPWKMRIARGFFFSYGFITGNPDGSPLVSEPCEVFEPSTLLYRWPVTWSTSADEYVLTVDDEEHLGLQTVVFHFQVRLLGATAAEGYFGASVPFTGTNFIDMPFYLDPYTPTFPLGTVWFTPATYAQGGSPWTL